MEWIASRSPSSGAHSRDPLARNDVLNRRVCLVAPARTLNRPISAVRHHDRSGDVGRQIGCEENRWPDAVFRFAGAPQRRVIDKNLRQLRIAGAHLLVQRCLDESRADRVDAYAILAELGGQRAGKAEHAMFRGGVGGGAPRGPPPKTPRRGGWLK